MLGAGRPPQLFRLPPLRAARARSTRTATASSSRSSAVQPFGTVKLLYALPLSDVDHTLARVRVFLLLGVLGGAILALLAGLFVSGRAMSPIVELTEAAREIERTRDATPAPPPSRGRR